MLYTEIEKVCVCVFDDVLCVHFCADVCERKVINE